MTSDGDTSLLHGLDGRIVQDYETFQALKTDWNDLLDRSDAVFTWLTHEWLSCWWRAFGTGAQMFVPTVRQEGRLVGAAPMMIVQTRTKGLMCKVLRFMENGITPRSHFLVAPNPAGASDDGMKALWRLLALDSKKWDFAILANVPEENLSFASWQAALASAGLHSVQHPDRQSPFVDLSDGYEAFRMSLTPKMRENIKASRSRLSRLGTIDLRPVLGTDEIPRALETCFAISARSWKAEAGLDLGARPADRFFYHNLSQDETLREKLYIWLLSVDERPAAFSMVIRSEESVSGLATDYDLEFRRSSPGVYILSRLLEQLPSLGVTRCDMSGELYDYKLSWTKQFLSHAQFWVFHQGAKSRLLHGERTSQMR
jgi:CelD/BcsL family acetyltransferase involved in cellulose biosynthesis